ncbi:DUF983 domain-containing protein [Aureimonas fodinaquatilis]|uniref:DUF983 domain-containing protein n=1 Tax=Aureimonas fodinaquatilis TaxID=2565783 RepID=A0A5B0E092_9HYPH|nr:DUF983 domain-containing protein [Aureimonas fodinaquatilis]KAA0972484.1 DUF983 domain-containing protein [Aureimonas fodinaquatilis]
MTGQHVATDQRDALKRALKGRCPYCGEGRLYAGALKLETRCNHCHADLTPLDQADGPAFFGMIIIGMLVTGLALYVEVAYMPPFWVHFLLWIPFTAIITLPLLRLFKSLMVGMQYRHKAAEGVWTRGDPK